MSNGADTAAVVQAHDRRATAQVSFAYLWWGGSALFWNELSSVSPLDQLSFRVLTAFIYLAIAVWLVRNRRNAVGSALSNSLPRNPERTSRHVLYGVGAALSISGNWALFLWAVSNGQAVEAALGYFLMPILSAGLGVGLLGERLRRLQVGALLLSTVGIVWTVVVIGRLPWVAILVGVTFAIYGLLRKQGPWDAVSGLTFETGLLAPFALVVIAIRSLSGEAVLGDGSALTILLLALTGVVTAIPLLAFASAARRVSLTVVGLLQYINPTLQFLVGWQLLGEQVSSARLAGFAWIWVALILIVVDELSANRGDLQGPVDGRTPTSDKRLVRTREGLATEEPSMRRER